MTSGNPWQATAPSDSPISALRYSEIIAANRSLRDRLTGPTYTIRVLSNIVVEPLAEILEYALREQGLQAQVSMGQYDNIVQDSQQGGPGDCVLVFWEAGNLVDGLQGTIQYLESHRQEELLEQACAQMDLVFQQLAGRSLVLFNRFSSLAFDPPGFTETAFSRLCRALNEHLEARRPANLAVIDIDRVLARVSLSASLDFRYFYSSKALYSVEFFKAYAQAVRPAILAALGKAKKALIFDCDNTLWHGILGEDGPEGIEMSFRTRSGAPFAEVQAMAMGLRRRGVLLGLCSKNDESQVLDVVAHHPDMQIRPADIVVHKVNWEDKARNLESISRDLNIGLDSLVFVDDSDFEVQRVRSALPEVTVLQVPPRGYQYPALLREHCALFGVGAVSREDQNRAELYQQQARRDVHRARFQSLEDYLRDLQLHVTVYTDDACQAPRIAQLTQRTNQFNLTTRRYSPADVQRLMEAGQHHVFAFQLADRFGQYGVVGACIAAIDSQRHEADLDTFLMSCRAIGRNVEFVLADQVLERLRAWGVAQVRARYCPTAKNQQTADFYDRLGFRRLNAVEGRQEYLLPLADYRPATIDYVRVSHGR